LEDGIAVNIQIHDCSPQQLFEKACRIQIERMRFSPSEVATIGISHRITTLTSKPKGHSKLRPLFKR